ncbi:MAG: PLP-dependent aminotransferase family protein [Sporolactobacillus sp.]
MEIVIPALNRESPLPLYQQLFQYFVHEMTQSRLPFGSRLPSKRKLSAFLKIGLNTIDCAYQQLLAEGYIESKPRSGMFVIYKKEQISLPVRPKISPKPEPIDSNKIPTIDFSHGKVDTEHFPFSAFRKYSRDLYSDEGSIFFQNGPFQGSLALRQEIAAYLYQSRGVICDFTQVVIGSGTQILLEQILHLIPQDVPFAMENPGFHRVGDLVRYMGRKLIPLPVESDGLALAPLKNLKNGVIYVTPSHQFPLGMILPITKRMALIDWTREKENRLVIEDDYDGEFRYAGKPIPSLQGLDEGRTVIYLGTFSKSLLPSLRVSYAVLPKKLVKSYQNSFSLLKQTASTINQELIRLFMQNGDWSRHLNRMRVIYKRKHQIIVQAIRENLIPMAQIIDENSGLHLILEINNGMDENKLITRALAYQVTVYPTSIYYTSAQKPDHPRLLLGYAGLSELQIQKGIQLLKEAWMSGSS